MNEDFVLVVFGITSNLAQIKLIPALYDLFKKKMLPSDFLIYGVSYKARNLKEMKEMIGNAVKNKSKEEISEDDMDNFFKKFKFINGNLEDKDFFVKIKSELENYTVCKNYIFYLATLPSLYGRIFANIHEVGLNQHNGGWVRLMIEKPIGNDLSSAKNLNLLLSKFFDEEQIFRIDHYLAKETIQNILTFRFNNEIFEPVLNNNFVDHIQITAAENFGLENRNAYYESVGALKDVGQNHILQMIAFATMERPVSWDNNGITSSRLKVLDSLKPIPDSLVLGQYKTFPIKNSNTNTFFAFKTELTVGKMSGVPIYVRAGKKLQKTVTEIAVIFKSNDKWLNGLIFRIQPNEGIILKIVTKKPGLKMELEDSLMEFCYRSSNGKLINPYERLIYDAIKGDPTFFNDASEIEAQWKFIDALNDKNKSLHVYKDESWGPEAAEKIIEKDGRKWMEPSDMYCAY